MIRSKLTSHRSFRAECRHSNKKLLVWTVNDPLCMMEAVRWDVDGILTDVTHTWLSLRSALRADYDAIAARHSRWFLWTGVEYYSAVRWVRCWANRASLESVAGPFKSVRLQ